MITDKDLVKIVNALKGFFATKDDLKNFATKDDLKNFATKDDLKNFATKDDLKNFATKDDLKNFATKDDLKNLEDRIDDKLIAFRSDILSHVDAVYKELLAMRDEQAMHTGSHMRMDEALANHEKRIERLESSSITP